MLSSSFRSRIGGKATLPNAFSFSRYHTTISRDFINHWLDKKRSQKSAAAGIHYSSR
jgi:hypothetical protein